MSRILAGALLIAAIPAGSFGASVPPPVSIPQNSGGGGGGTPGGSNGQAQFNNGGGFGGTSGQTSDGTVTTFAPGDLKLSGSVSGGVTLNAPNSGGGTVTLPGGNVTVLSNTGSQTVTNKTIDCSLNTCSNVPTGALATPQGNGAKVQLSTGTTTANDCVKFDASGNTADAGAACGSGGGAATFTDGANTVTSVTTATFGSGMVVGGSAGSATVNLTVPRSTKSADYTVAAADMAGTINLTGTHTLTIPAISSTVFASGMSSCFSNIGSGTWTISSTPTINGRTGTSVLPGGGGCLVSNGTSLDWQGGMQQASSTVLGGFTASGNTTKAGTVSGSLTSGNCIKSDASGNLVDAATTCGGGGGGNFPALGYVSGQHYTPPVTNEVADTPFANFIYFLPFFEQGSRTWTQMSVFATGATSGGHCHLGVYTSSGGLPAALVSDAGAVTITASTANYYKATGLSIALSANTAYWTAVLCDAGVTLWGVSGSDRALDQYIGANLDPTSRVVYAQSQSYGALPSIVTPTQTSGSQPLVYMDVP